MSCPVVIVDPSSTSFFFKTPFAVDVKATEAYYRKTKILLSVRVVFSFLKNRIDKSIVVSIT